MPGKEVEVAVFMTKPTMSMLTGVVNGVFMMTTYVSGRGQNSEGGATSGRLKVVVNPDDVIIDCCVAYPPHHQQTRKYSRMERKNQQVRYDPIGNRRDVQSLS